MPGTARPDCVTFSGFGLRAAAARRFSRAGREPYIGRIVTEILFYHMLRQPLEKVLPTLVERSLGRGWQAAIQAASEERLQALDDQLWTYSDESFLPHGTDRDPDASGQPVVLTLRDVNPNAASIRFLVEGADLPPDADAYERICILFDGTDQDALLRAREQWRQAKEAGHAVAYWQQDDSGRWNKKA